MAQHSSDAVAVITVNWNGWENTIKCLEALRLTKGVAWHLYIIDNASSDDSVNRLANLGSDVTLICSAENSGWTGGNNQGILRALKDGFDYLFILNNDAFVEPTTLTDLLSFSRRHARPPVIGPVHLNPQTGLADFTGAKIDHRTGFPIYENGHSSDAYKQREWYHSAFVSGAGMFVSRAHFVEVGLFDQRYFLNYDETDWCFNVKKAGFDVVIIPSARIHHSVSATIGGLESPLNIYFMTRNSLLFAEMHCTVRQRFMSAVKLIKTGRNLTRRRGALQRTFGLFSGERSIRAFRAGVRDYLFRRFGDCPKAIRSV